MRLAIALAMLALGMSPLASATDCPYYPPHCQSRIEALAGPVAMRAEASATLDASVESAAAILSVRASATGELVIYVSAVSGLANGSVTVTVGVNETKGVTWTGPTSAAATVTPAANVTRAAFPFALGSDLGAGQDLFVPFHLDTGGERAVGHLVFSTPAGGPTPLPWLLGGALGAIVGAVVTWWILRR